ncbi:MAG: Beta-N-acetylhexosaminidase [Microbacteriaceae bacterium]|jgi:beta-N-acetylhexosaminidase|nr:Beta-N-acetylhexosaminidase [Microbacteriaceae bacterium]
MIASLAMLLAVGLVGCATPGAAPSAPPSTAAPTPTPTVDPIAGLTLEQRVGQLFMVGTGAIAGEAETLAAVRDRHVGNVFLAGRSGTGTAATAAVTARFTALVTAESTAGVPLLIATDQEGGQVQVLRGPGFSDIPTAVDQGRLDAVTLRADATVWAGELASAGVNMNLAPVVDLVPSAAAAASNPPIGVFDRGYGHDPATILAKARSFREGMTAGGVVSVLKHFPGLGLVTQNTDTSSNVVDSVTTAGSPSVDIYRAEIGAGAQSIMMSSATYTAIDPTAPALFSESVVSGLLRDELGFDGVIMTDDVAASAQVQAWAPADRAILAIEAGCDMVLVARTPAMSFEMVDAVVAKARADAAFADRVDDAARRVLALKQARR